MVRTRSAVAHEKVLQAALATIAERGIEGASMDAIAQLAGVSKATVYNHWSTKDDLCLEAIASTKSQPPPFNSGDARADIRALLDHFARARRPETLARIWPRIVSYAMSNDKFGKAFRECFWTPGRRALAKHLRRAVEHRELRADIDLETAVDLLIGPILSRRLMGTKLDAAFVGQVVAAYWHAHAIDSKSRGR